MPVSVAKFTQFRSFTALTGCCTQAVRKDISTPAIGAQMFCGSHEPSLIDCLIMINIFGTHSADKSVRIYSSRFLT
jgi:hypothetical protein